MFGSPAPGMVVAASAAWRTTQVGIGRGIWIIITLIRQGFDQCQVLRCYLLKQARLLLQLSEELIHSLFNSQAHCSACRHCRESLMRLVTSI